MGSSDSDALLLRQVISDLRFLRDDWSPSVALDNLRRGSPTLRRLLNDGDLQRAWRIAGHPRQPMITAPTLAPLLGRFDRRRVRWAFAGGARCDGVIVAASWELDHELSPNEAEELLRGMSGGPTMATLPLDEYLASTCVVVNGSPITRPHVVKFVANRLGGAHFDPRREKPRKREADESLFALIDRAMQVARLPVVYYELLSIGQSLVSSEDVNRLLSSLN